MPEGMFGRGKFIAPLALALLALFLTGWMWIANPLNQDHAWLASYLPNQQLSTPVVAPVSQSPRLLNGKLASLGWIVGNDCRRGMRAYLQTASTNPDAAIVGTGWVDPTNGQLINGVHNNCMPGSLSMDNVVQLIHSKGGLVYLTITMMTDGSADAWTPEQQSEYIDKATTNQ